MQRQHVGRDLRLRQHGLYAGDFALAWQEHQQVTRMTGQRVLDGTPGLVLQCFLAPRREMRHLDRIAASCTGQPLRAQPVGQPLPVQGGRHHHDAQVAAQFRLHVQCQRQAKVTGKMALVEFVEHDRANAFQHRIVLQHPGQDAFGDHFYPCARRRLVVEADPVTHGFAHRFAELPGHEARGRTRGNAARFQHHDLAALQPGRIQQGQRHLGSLARARRRFQHQPRMRLQCGMHLRQQRRDREGRRRHRGRIRWRPGKLRICN